MADTIKIKKGLKSNLPIFQLAELGFTTDEERLYIGGSNGNIMFPNMKDIAYLQSNVYGVSYQISTDTFTRLNSSYGLTAGNNFDNIMPWAGMRRCNLADDLTVNAYYGDYTYIEDGSNGQVMVEVPGFYYRRYFSDNDHIVTLISMSALPGFKYSQWHYDKLGNVRNKAYFSAFEGSIFDVSASATEVDTLTITTPCTTTGNVTITLDKYNIFTVALLNTDNTTDLVASKIRNATYTGWTISGTGSIVIFTCNTTGLKTTAIFTDSGVTGVTATVIKTTSGAGGYTQLDAGGTDFTVSTGDKLCSIARVKPASGMFQSLTIGNSRKIANNRGTGWEQQFFTAVSAIQMLFTVEYSGLNSQSLIGNGIANITDDTTTNMAINTGATSSLGNKSGKISVVHYKTGQTDYAVSYRGIENFWGNIYKLVDGFNIKNGFAYISNVNGDFVSDKIDGQYIKVGELSHVNGYMSKALINGNFDYGFIPAEALGSSSTKFADYYYQNAVGSFVALLGGNWYVGAYAGAFYWYLNYGSGYYNRYISARLCA